MPDYDDEIKLMNQIKEIKQPTKKKYVKKVKLADIFEIPKNGRCPKGYKICRCNPKKLKCKKK
tara:strand:- start:1461 stop:1649 length:189 start_codon:yes stop_codon:yes gene_type:complete